MEKKNEKSECDLWEPDDSACCFGIVPEGVGLSLRDLEKRNKKNQRLQKNLQLAREAREAKIFERKKAHFIKKYGEDPEELFEKLQKMYSDLLDIGKDLGIVIDIH